MKDILKIIKWYIITIVIFLITAIIGIFLYFRYLDNRPFVQNGQAVISIIENLEDGQIVFLDDITPFDWDLLHAFGPYTPPSRKAETLGISERYLFQDVGNEGTVFIYFLYEERLVARMFGSSWSRYSFRVPLGITMPEDELEFVVEIIERELSDSTREVRVLSLIE